MWSPFTAVMHAFKELLSWTAKWETTRNYYQKGLDNVFSQVKLWCNTDPIKYKHWNRIQIIALIVLVCFQSWLQHSLSVFRHVLLSGCSRNVVVVVVLHLTSFKDYLITPLELVWLLTLSTYLSLLICFVHSLLNHPEFPKSHQLIIPTMCMAIQ